MAFTLYNWSCVSTSVNQGLVLARISTPSSDTETLQGSMNLFSYHSLDAVGTIDNADYFLPVINQLKISDVIMVTGSDASTFLQVATITYPSDVSSGTVTTEAFTPVGAVATANIEDLAVTTAKINDLAVTAGKLAADAVETAKIDDGAVTSAKLADTVLHYAAVEISAAEFNGMFAAPKVLVAAPGANKLLVLDKVQLLMTYGAANYAAGGTTAIQYDVTANGAGVIASTTLANTVFQAAASTGFNFNAGVVAETFTTCVNKSLAISNISGAFTTGDSTFVAHVWYKIIPTT
jgi:hypothetical protein